LDAICRLIEHTCEIVGTASNGQDAIRLVEEKKPDIVLLDISLPQLNGLDAGRQIKQIRPETRLIFLTHHMNVAFAKEAFESGASGYVLKQGSSVELLDALQDVSEGKFFLSSLMQARVLQRELGVSGQSGGQSSGQASEQPSDLFTALTMRQRQILQLVGEGKSGREIASSLDISIKTVEFHKKHLMADLNLGSSAALIRYAVEQGLVPQ
jgi:DNA-binding NarL/FixJ family response regulator